MKLATWLILPLLLAAGVFFYMRQNEGVYGTSGLSVGVCQANAEISPTTRAEIDATALTFMDVFSRDPMEARGLMSRRGQAATRERAAMTGAHGLYHATEVTGDREVTETYLLRFVSGSQTGERTPCGFQEGRPVFVARGGTAMSAIVLMTEEMDGGSQRTTSLWLEHENGAWRVLGMNFGLSRVAGLDSEQLWQAAKQQRANGRDFNAAMLYVAAQATLQRGSFYQARVTQAFNADYNTFEAPALMRGTPPFAWTFDGDSFSVNEVQYMGLGSGEVALIIDHASDAWTETAEAESINRRLIDGFVASNPHWRETFDAIVARAAKPGSNQHWGTVYSATGGYDGPQHSE